jgi:hypothetical protein
VLPQVGDTIRLSVERNIVISGYTKIGVSKLFQPPWQLNTLSADDYTGVKLPKDAVVEVRDVSLGRTAASAVLVTSPCLSHGL